MFSIDIVGIIGGLIIVGSSYPQIRLLTKEPDCAPSVSKSRQVFIIIGNVLWVIYGVIVNEFPVYAMCSINILLNLWILLLAKSNRRIRNSHSQIP